MKMRTVGASLIVIGLLLLVVFVVAMIYGAITGDVFGLISFAAVTGFFVGVSAEQVVFGIVILLFTLVPNFGLEFFNLLKERWGFVDKQAHDFIFAVCYIISAIALLVTDTLDLNGLEFTIQTVFAVGTSIYGLSQLAFKRLYPKLS